jgi:hypothetical protein
MKSATVAMDQKPGCNVQVRKVGKDGHAQGGLPTDKWGTLVQQLIRRQSNYSVT